MNEVPEFYQFTLSYDKEIIFYCPNTCIYERKKVEIFKIRHFSTFARVGGFFKASIIFKVCHTWQKWPCWSTKLNYYFRRFCLKV